MLKSIKTAVIRIHQDEEGMEAVQIILILGIAAMVCLGVTKVAGVDLSGEKEGGSGWFSVVANVIGEFLGKKKG